MLESLAAKNRVLPAVTPIRAKTRGGRRIAMIIPMTAAAMLTILSLKMKWALAWRIFWITLGIKTPTTPRIMARRIDQERMRPPQMRAKSPAKMNMAERQISTPCFFILSSISDTVNPRSFFSSSIVISLVDFQIMNGAVF